MSLTRVSPTAFTTVAARRALPRPEPPMAPNPQIAPPLPQQKKKTEWPPSVREYVQRSYGSENSIDGIERLEMERKLRMIITEAAELNQLWTRNWATYPLPQEILRGEKTRALGLANTASPLRSEPLREDARPGRFEAATPAKSHKGKKRKSTDDVTNKTDENVTPPRRKANRVNVEGTATPEEYVADAFAPLDLPAEKRQRKNRDEPSKPFSQDLADLEKRRHRFNNIKARQLPHSPSPSSRDGTPIDARQGPIVGTCQQLEKRYLRLTSAPKPETVRPQPVLEKTLALLKQKWKEERNYNYICDQFKSLRQDLTVQHIKNSFTVDVYEIHARIAMEQGDLGEYNQCQTQLRALYSQNLGGHPAEFLAYRILYFIYTCNRSDMNDLLAHLTQEEKRHEEVQHALKVREALALGDYHSFFKLYLANYNMSAYLIDHFIGRERVAALASICKSYKPAVSVRFLTDELAFDSDRDCAQFIFEHGGGDFLSSKDDVVVFETAKAARLFEQQKAAAFSKVDIKGQM